MMKQLEPSKEEMMQYPFIKMHGIKNDFVIIDTRNKRITIPKKHIQHIADRHVGVGCDQLIVVSNTKKADIKMTIYNQDGTESGACGNATRCVAMLWMDEHKCNRVSIETSAAILHASRHKQSHIISVDMGAPRLEAKDIPLCDQSLDPEHLVLPDIPLSDILGKGIAVNMGNPHIVFFVDNIHDIDLHVVGPIIEHHTYFPERANVNIAHITEDQDIELRVWERGVGETLACGSGACATAVAACVKGLVDRHVSVCLKGGILHIDWQEEDNHVVMTGEAETSFTGVIAL